MRRGGDQQPPIEARDPALDLLRDLGAKATLSPAAKQRIGAVLASGPSEKPRGWLIAVPIAAVLAMLLVLVAMRARTHAPTAAIARQEFLVPACGISRIVNDSLRYRGSFIGPAEVGVEADGLISLRSGRAILTTGARAADVSTAGARISVQPNSLVEVVVRRYGTVRVAAFAGRAQVVLAGSRSTTIIDTGAVWNDGSFERGTSDEARQARELVDESAATHSLCPAEPTSEQPTPPVQDNPPGPPKPVVVATTRIVSPRPNTRRPDSEETDSSPATALVPLTEEPPASTSASPTEAAILGNAIRRLRQDHDPRSALALLDGLQSSHPNGDFAQEIMLVRIEALRQTGEQQQALALLDAVSLPNVPRGAELLLLRAELRSERGRYAEAADDYTRLLSYHGTSEKALVGRAACRFKLGDDQGARRDLTEYLLKYPNGSYSADARRSLVH
jgi:hypothetical protein